MNVPTRQYALIAVLGLLAAGCPLEQSKMSVRADVHTLMWPGDDLVYLGNTGSDFSLEIAPGDMSQPAMGPLYIGGAVSQTTIEDDSVIVRGGLRARSSMLESQTNTYPYAMVGVYAAFLDPTDRTSKFGGGVEGGYGFRLGMGESAAVDLEMIFEYGYFENAFSIMSTRLGGGLMVQF